jgi:hypothetical protein
MGQAQNITRVYRRQGKRFESWMNDWLTCGYLLWKVQQEVGTGEGFDAWLKKHCRSVDAETAREMVRQLLETTPGQALLASLEHPNPIDL